MIHAFLAKNYYSFEQDTEVDFLVDDKAPSAGGYARTGQDAKVSLIEAIVGPNASGKTTALKALAFIKWMITDSFRYDSAELPFRQFAGNKGESVPTELQVVFELEDGIYTYNLVVNSKRVLSEELSVRSLTVLRTTNKKLLSRKWVPRSKSYEVDGSAIKLTEDYWSRDALKNTSLLAAATRFGNEQSLEIVKYWSRVESNVNIDERFYGGSVYRYEAYRALEYYEKHDGSRESAEKNVRRYDLGIDTLGRNGTINHKFGDKTVALDLMEESSGTQQFLGLMHRIESVMESGSIAIIDEFDAYLHTAMFTELIKKFLDPSINTKNAQLLISTHDLQILDILDKYQLIFAEKNDRNASVLRRLDSYPNVRSDDNFISKYIRGYYGAWPKIRKEDS